MRVFITGATGFVGSAVVQELLSAGHHVLGLARSEQAIDALTRLGAEVHCGDLTDLSGLAAGARACDGVIHTAFIHDFSKYEENAEIDRRAVAAIADALAGSDRPFIATSVVTLLAPGRVGTEEDGRASPTIPRAASEATVLGAADRGIRSSVVRLPFSVHGQGDRGFVPALVDLARQKGVAGYVGDGTNRWPAVNRRDAARLFRLALDKAKPATALHAVAEEGIAMHDIAEAIGIGLGLPVRSIGFDDAAKHFEWLGRFIGIDQPISSTLTREWMNWRPQENGLLTDLKASGYFDRERRSKF